MSFLKFLVMCACHSLSKTAAYSTMYNTPEAKVEVLLFKWGFADAMKLGVVNRAVSVNNNTTTNVVSGQYSNFSKTR